MTGVIIFRAQPFHNGHLYAIQKAFEDCGELHIFIGSADKVGTKRNPLPIDFRIMLVQGALHEVFSMEELKHIHVYPLDDLTDESDNSHNWGRYLYMKMLTKTRDNDMTIYYSDDPHIIFSWFDADERWCLRFKLLDRYDGISATKVRNLLLSSEFSDKILGALVPNFVLIHKDEIIDYLKEAR